jgi:hypothetical protein
MIDDSFFLLILSLFFRISHERSIGLAVHLIQECRLLLLLSTLSTFLLRKNINVPKSSRSDCHCLNANALDCMCTRYMISRSLAAITGACTCHCHFSSLNIPITSTEWIKQKKAESSGDPWRSGSAKDRQIKK